MQKLALGMSPLVWAGVIACGGSHYRVIDTATEKTYFTDRIEAQKGGAIILKDANTN